MKQSVGESITDEIHKHRYTHIPIYRSIHTCFHPVEIGVHTRTNTDALSHTIKHTRTQNTNRAGAHSPIRTCSKRIIVVLAIICPKYKLTRVFSQTNNASFMCGFVQFYSLNCFTLSVRYPFNKFCLHVQFLL